MQNLPLLMGAAEGGAQGSPQGSMMQIGVIVLVFAIFWLLIIRPQRKKQKDEQKMREAIKKGDRVTSIGGIRGVVKNVTEKTVIVEVDNKGNTLEFTKSAIGTVESGEAPSKTDASKADAGDSAEQK